MWIRRSKAEAGPLGERLGTTGKPSVDDTDYYDRRLRYVHDAGRDTGLGLIRLGLAKPRYDSTDGYDRHPRQRRYHRADRNSPNVC